MQTGLSDLGQISCLGSRSPVLVVAEIAQLLRRSRRGSNVIPSLLKPTLRPTSTSPRSADIDTPSSHNPWSAAQKGFEHSPITSTRCHLHNVLPVVGHVRLQIATQST